MGLSNKRYMVITGVWMLKWKYVQNETHMESPCKPVSHRPFSTCRTANSVALLVTGKRPV